MKLFEKFYRKCIKTIRKAVEFLDSSHPNSNTLKFLHCLLLFKINSKEKSKTNENDKKIFIQSVLQTKKNIYSNGGYFLHHLHFVFLNCPRSLSLYLYRCAMRCIATFSVYIISGLSPLVFSFSLLYVELRFFDDEKQSFMMNGNLVP